MPDSFDDKWLDVLAGRDVADDTPVAREARALRAAVLAQPALKMAFFPLGGRIGFARCADCFIDFRRRNLTYGFFGRRGLAGSFVFGFGLAFSFFHVLTGFAFPNAPCFQSLSIPDAIAVPIKKCLGNPIERLLSIHRGLWLRLSGFVRFVSAPAHAMN